jgi:hypothetical protein
MRLPNSETNRPWQVTFVAVVVKHASPGRTASGENGKVG